MAQRAGRLTCPRCGANNFDTVTACWKCGTALGTGASAAPSAAPVPSVPMAAPVERVSPPPATYAAPAYVPAAATGDPGVARRAAIALALTIPWIGLPVGWVFMMIEDSRKQAIGRVCAVWSMIGLVLHLLLMYWATLATMNFVKTWLPYIVGGYQNGLRGGSSSGL